jgi:type II secretory pathway pseudopilin PulG
MLTMSQHHGDEAEEVSLCWPKVRRRAGRSAQSGWRPVFCAFTLVEVMIAVGVFAASVTAVIALLPALARQGGEATVSLAAQSLPEALHAELSRQAASGFDALAGQVPVMNGALESGLAFVADRQATRLHSRDYLEPAVGVLPAVEQYFLIECWRFPNDPLRFDPQKGFLALAVRVSWPYRLPGTSAPSDPTTRFHLLFTVVLNR